jgi:hypothetical protein
VSKKRPERPQRAEKRMQARVLRGLVRDREKLAALAPGATEARAIAIATPAVIESRVRSMRCPQCDGEYQPGETSAPSAGVRRVDVTCRLCHVKRALWFRLGGDAPN